MCLSVYVMYVILKYIYIASFVDALASIFCSLADLNEGTFFCLIFVLQGGDRQVHMCERWGTGHSGSLTPNFMMFFINT